MTQTGGDAWDGCDAGVSVISRQPDGTQPAEELTSMRSLWKSDRREEAGRESCVCVCVCVCARACCLVTQQH